MSTATVISSWVAQTIGFLFLLTIPFQDVTRRRVERLALREALPITVDNGPLVIGYLATTRRWRGCGLLAVPVVVSIGAALREGHGTVNGGIAFVGWFVGAVIAEWRLAGPAPAGPRRASLEPRTVAGQLGRPLWLLVTGLSGLAAAFTLALLVAAIAARPALVPAVAVDVALLAVAAASVWAVAGRVVRRPRPETAPDVRAADDALRRRSLHVLAGSWLAISAFVALAALAQANHHRLWFHGGIGTGLVTMALVVSGPYVGVAVAVRPRRPTRVRSA